MGSLLNSKPRVPYLGIKDCSQGFCGLYCTEWCYKVSPPSPPIGFLTENPGTNFSPILVAIIGILASAFLLVSYYAIISKYCRDGNSSRRRERHDPDEGLEENEDPSSPEPWHGDNNGLNEALIKAITVCKYKTGQGLIEGTDCSVCLSEFEEDESLRLLPKCSHAFHVACIDTWLESHSNCPLCRVNIISIIPPPPPLPPPISESPPNIESVSETTGNEVILEDIETGAIIRDETSRNGEFLEEEEKDIVIEIRDENFKQIKRSVSMSSDCGQRLSLADVLLLNQDVGSDTEEYSLQSGGVGSSREKLSGTSKLRKRDTGLHCASSPVSMKRSRSSERFSSSRRAGRRNMTIP